MAKICKICKRDINICREDDKKLIKPFNPSDFDLTEYYYDDNNMENHVWRVNRATEYVMGRYDSSTNKTYYLWRKCRYSHRDIVDIYLSLPLCVWEDDLNLRKFDLIMVMEYNIKTLPIEQDYIQLLIKLFTD